MVGKSIKAKVYKKNEFEKTRDYLKLNFISILNIALVSDGYFVPDVDINSMFVLLKMSIGLKTTV
jgi:hypothetical protein